MIQISQLYHKQYILYFTRIVQATTIFEQQLIRGGGGGGGGAILTQIPTGSNMRFIPT